MKRTVDILAATALLVILSPIMAMVGIMVRHKLGSPVLFRQVRPGLHGEPFTILKFRTMRSSPDGRDNVDTDEQRMTSFGRWLRATSLDELPELWNVLRGDMSLVGPRPLLMQYLPLYTPEQMRRHEVRPGLTGWAQVNGRNALDWEDKFKLDTWYVDHQSIWVDIRILFRTAACLINREGISSARSVTMPEFKRTTTTKAATRNGVDQ